MSYKKEVENGKRFKFGSNWKLFLRSISLKKISLAKKELKRKLNIKNLKDKSFLDIGSGSGLISLAAKKLGARVFSFDYDLESVECTEILKDSFFPNDNSWKVENGSVLNLKYLNKLGKFDIVYSWGVLHHTGRMWKALENASNLVKRGGILFISIYNDMGVKSRRWLLVKKLYNNLPKFLKWIVFVPAFLKIWVPDFVKDLFKLKPFVSWIEYQKEESRGFDPFTDAIDWIGGYPYEFAKPEEIYDFYIKKGFVLIKMKTCGGGMGCNEYIFKKI